MNARFAATCLAATCFVACASASSPDSGGATTGAAASATTTAPALAGRYPFVFEESEVFAPAKARCRESSNGDASKAAACLDEIRGEASKEGIRFDADAGGHVTWTSYGEESGAEVAFHRVPIALTSDSPKLLSVRTLAPATGLLAAKRPIPEGTVMRVELVDEETIAMLDPKKGRLVFRRSSAK